MGSKSIVINRPVREVFARVTDLEHAREWAPQMGKMHLSAGTGTKVTQSTEMGLAGLLGIFSPLIAGEAQKEEDAELDRLKEIIERS